MYAVQGAFSFPGCMRAGEKLASGIYPVGRPRRGENACFAKADPISGGNGPGKSPVIVFDKERTGKRNEGIA